MTLQNIPAKAIAALGVATLALAISPASASPSYAADSGGTKPMYRLYNKATAEHLYTADAHEAHVLLVRDWTYEGGCVAIASNIIHPRLPPL